MTKQEEKTENISNVNDFPSSTEIAWQSVAVDLAIEHSKSKACIQIMCMPFILSMEFSSWLFRMATLPMSDTIHICFGTCWLLSIWGCQNQQYGIDDLLKP